MQLSARNQFSGTVIAVKEGAVNGVVTIDLGSTLIKADITMESIRSLGIVEGVSATALAKATNVLFAPGDVRLPISARNRFVGKIEQVTKGAVNAHVTMRSDDGLELFGDILNEEVDELGLRVGGRVTAFIKSTDVLVGQR